MFVPTIDLLKQVKRGKNCQNKDGGIRFRNKRRQNGRRRCDQGAWREASLEKLMRTGCQELVKFYLGEEDKRKGREI